MKLIYDTIDIFQSTNGKFIKHNSLFNWLKLPDSNNLIRYEDGILLYNVGKGDEKVNVKHSPDTDLTIGPVKLSIKDGYAYMM